MKTKVKQIPRLSAALFLSGVIAAMAQTSAPAAAAKVNDSFRAQGRHLIYVALPASLKRAGWLNGGSIVVLDADDNYRFVKRIPSWDYAASMSPEQVSGIAASPVTNRDAFDQFKRILGASSMFAQSDADALIARGVFRSGTTTRVAPPAPRADTRHRKATGPEKIRRDLDTYLSHTYEHKGEQIETS